MILLLYISVIHLLEAWLEEVVIALKNPYVPEYSKMNTREHFRSALLAASWLFGVSALAVYFRSYWMLPAILINRRIFFDYTLIILRDRPGSKYEGNDWWTVNVFKRIFGANGRKIELVAELLITIFCIINTIYVVI